MPPPGVTIKSSLPPLNGFEFSALSDLLEQLGADGWLLYDFRGVNPAATRVLGIHGMGTRRFFVLLPRVGRPAAIVHRIELSAFEDFPGDVRPYAAWGELHSLLRPLVNNRTVAMEISPRDGIPYLDRVPYGVVDLIEWFGARVVPSGPLITRFVARWSVNDLVGHRRAAQVLAEIAPDVLRWAGAEQARGIDVRETMLQRRVLDAFARAGLVTDHPPVVAFQANTANPHYEPLAGADRALASGDVILLDLWAGVVPRSVLADQTWMGFAGWAPDPEVQRIWQTVRAARDAVITQLRDGWRQPLTGAEVDNTARAVIREAGFGDYFPHRTGHSIDRELQGSGPHLDNYETTDDRALVAGVGFSVEPGIYLPGRFGVRSEVNVFLNKTGPEVTPAAPQTDLLLV